jgi:hypothetical protein
MVSREKWEKELEAYNAQKKERQKRREILANTKQEAGVLNYGTFDPEDPKKKYKGFEQQYALVGGILYNYIKVEGRTRAPVDKDLRGISEKVRPSGAGFVVAPYAETMPK